MRTSIGFTFRASRIEGKEGSILFRVTKDRKTIAITLRGDSIFPNEWDAPNQRVLINTEDPYRKIYLEDINTRLRQIWENLWTIIYELEKINTSYTVEEVITIYQNRIIGHSLFAYVEKKIQQIKSETPRTASSYRSTANKIKAFAEGKDITLEQLTPEYLQVFEQHMLQLGHNRNTTSYYLRNLRAIFHHAVKDKVVDQLLQDPFADVFTGSEVTEKLKVEKNVIIKLRNLRLEGEKNEPLALARNLFLLSYYLEGMPFMDLVYLKKEDIIGNYVVYNRRQKGQYTEVKISPEAEALLTLYRTDDNDYMLPLLHEEYRFDAYQNALQLMNRRLKALSQLIGLDTPLTTEASRRLWESEVKTSSSIS